MKTLLKTIGAGLGLVLGSGAIYALFASESARLMGSFLFGAFLFGSTVLITVLLVNRQWSRTLGEQRTVHNYRYQVPPPQSSAGLPNAQPPYLDLLPPPPEQYYWSAPVDNTVNVDDESIA